MHFCSKRSEEWPRHHHLLRTDLQLQVLEVVLCCNQPIFRPENEILPVELTTVICSTLIHFDLRKIHLKESTESET